MHNWFSSANKITWTLHSRDTLPKIGVTNPGIRYEGQPDVTFNDPNHGETLISGLEGTVNSGAFITLCEGFTDAAETAAFWRSRDTTYYDYPNQRLNILRRYSQNAFSDYRMIQAEACDYYHDLTPGNGGGTFRDGDLDIQKTTDALGGWNVFDAEAEEWLEWKEMAIPKNPIFEIHYAAEDSVQIQFILDEQEGSILSLAPTGGEQIWATSRDTSLNIPQNAYQNLKIKIISGKVSLNYFTIMTEGCIGKVAIASPVSGTRYLQTDKISIKAKVSGFAAKIQKLELYVDSTFIYEVSSSKIDTLLNELTIGTHNILLKAIDENGNSAIDSCSIYIGAYSYTISSSIIGEGEVIFDPPGGTYIEGTKVLVLAKPAYSYFFDSWSGDTVSNENPLSYTENTDIKLIANFSLDSNPTQKMNFQPNDTQVPDGYLKDTGLEYGLRDNAYVYGWIGGPNNGTRDRKIPDNNLYGTLNHMQVGGNHVWEMEVANGAYEVHLIMGDPGYKNQINSVNIEDVVVEDPDGEDNFDEYLVVVKVTDNRLTISPGAGAVNAKICFVDIKPTTVGNETAKSFLDPLEFDLKQNYPNPFNQNTEIAFYIPKPAQTKLSVYNIHGQKIATLVSGKIDAGPYHVSFNAEYLPAGVYFYKLQSGEFSTVRKMLLHK